MLRDTCTKGEATYCPEDNKLRLYVGRVPRDEYEELRSQGWKSTPKQDCDFVATWAPYREDTALAMIEDGDTIGDEDQSPEDRAADRAERFSNYRDKRRNEAHGHADTFGASPSVHGYQNQAKADRAASRHDRQRVKAYSQWDKAEYWQQRTAGVISDALYKSSASVRRGRIVRLETEKRKDDKHTKDAQTTWDLWQKVKAEQDPEKAHRMAYTLANLGYSGYENQHPREPEKPTTSLYSLLTYEADPITGHEAADLYCADSIRAGEPGSNSDRQSKQYTLRIAYEKQMLEGQGGSVADLEIVPGGYFGKHQVLKVNKSNATKQPVSVSIMGPHPWKTEADGSPVIGLQSINIQRLGEGSYRAPTPEDLETLKATRASLKAKTQSKNAGKPKLINPTGDDAERLQAHLNAKAASRVARAGWYKGKNDDPTPTQVLRLTQKQYSANSGGNFSSCNTEFLLEDGTTHQTTNMWTRRDNIRKVCKLRIGPPVKHRNNHYSADSVIVITDKPQKPIPELSECLAHLGFHPTGQKVTA